MQEDRLRKRLGKLKMDMNVVRGDGNCLVRPALLSPNFTGRDACSPVVLQCTCKAYGRAGLWVAQWPSHTALHMKSITVTTQLRAPRYSAQVLPAQYYCTDRILRGMKPVLKSLARMPCSRSSGP